jgi:hypothetical protein
VDQFGDQTKEKQHLELRIGTVLPKKIRFQNKTVVSSRFLWKKKKVICVQVLITFYLFMISVALSSNVIFFLVFLPHNASPTCHFPAFIIRSP